MWRDFLYLLILGMLAVVGGGILAALVDEPESGFPASVGLSVEELKAELASGSPPILIDVRAELAYRAGHLPGALSFPLAELRSDRAVRSRLVGMEGRLVLYCANRYCLESREAAEILKSLGRRDIRIFSGGWQAWKESRKP